LGRKGFSVLRKTDTKKVSFVYQKIHKIFGLVSPIPKSLLLARVETSLAAGSIVNFIS